jgi:hypothetical protein
MAAIICWISTARDEAFTAWTKMGFPMQDEVRTREARTAMIEEAKSQVLEVNAAYLEKVLAGAGETYPSLVAALRDAIHVMKIEATTIAARVKRDLAGPPR